MERRFWQTALSPLGSTSLQKARRFRNLSWNSFFHDLCHCTCLCIEYFYFKGYLHQRTATHFYHLQMQKLSRCLLRKQSSGPGARHRFNIPYRHAFLCANLGLRTTAGLKERPYEIMMCCRDSCAEKMRSEVILFPPDLCNAGLTYSRAFTYFFSHFYLHQVVSIPISGSICMPRTSLSGSFAPLFTKSSIGRRMKV